MKVKDLLAILSRLDPEADVLLATQPGYPTEYALRGVAVRSDVCEGHRLPAGAQANDVLLVEGQHLRYGMREVWNRAVRE